MGKVQGAALRGRISRLWLMLLSFCCVISGLVAIVPSAGDTFYNAGYQGGVQAATALDGESSILRPEYVVLDPEGDKIAASTFAEWADFIDGWAAGITSVDSRLTLRFTPASHSMRASESQV